MKKHLVMITFVLVALLSACQNTGTNIEPEIEIELTLTANFPSITTTSVLGDIVNEKQSYTITAPEVAGYDFSYWRELDTTTIVSFNAIFNYVPTASISFEAIYELINDTLNVGPYTGDAAYLTMDLDTYYDDAEGLYGVTLFDTLHTIINDGFVGVTYGEARYILDESDMDPNNSSNIILVYRGTSISGVWDQGNTWNREHVWPQSKLGESANNGTVNTASDLYNLMPSNPSENSSRGNDPYSEMGLGYEPRDEVKGDVARAVFYMMLMYEDLNLVNTSPGVHEMGYLDELLQWHIDDPVDTFEMNRLEVIYGEQLNRNPFVDYPQFVEMIWMTD